MLYNVWQKVIVLLIVACIQPCSEDFKEFKIWEPGVFGGPGTPSLKVNRDLPGERSGLNYVFLMGKALNKKKLHLKPCPLVVVIGGIKVAMVGNAV